MYITTTGTIVAQLTRYGRQILADNSAMFKITKYRFSDDEINYANFNGDSVDEPNLTVLATPVLEANTFGGVPTQRNTLFSRPLNTLQIARLDSNIDFPFSDGKQNMRLNYPGLSIMIINSNSFTSSNPFSFKVRTNFGRDTSYLISAPSFLKAVDLKVDAVNSTDPWETFQNQSEGVIQFYVDTSPVSDISSTMDAPGYRDFLPPGDKLGLAYNISGAQIYDYWRQYVTSRAGEPKTFGKFGLTFATLDIRGSDTNQGYKIFAIIYSPEILNMIVSRFIQAEQGFGRGELGPPNIPPTEEVIVVLPDDDTGGGDTGGRDEDDRGGGDRGGGRDLGGGDDRGGGRVPPDSGGSGDRGGTPPVRRFGYRRRGP